MRKARWLLLGVAFGLVLVGQVSAASQWLVQQKNPPPQGQWTLYDDGSVTRGDPKTTYDQQENCGHSVNGSPCQAQTKTQTPPLDITGWRLNGQGGGGHTDWKVEYLNPKRAKGTIDRVIITYDLTKGKATGAIREQMKTNGADYTKQTLSLDTVKAPLYYTQLYGWTK